MTPMTHVRIALIAALALVTAPLTLAQQKPAPSASSAVTLVDYQRALSLQAKYTGTAANVADAPVWLPSGKFWYRRSVKGGREFVIVDSAAAAKKPAFDHQRLAAGIAAATAKTVTPVTLPFTTFAMAADEQSLTFSEEGGTNSWTC